MNKNNGIRIEKLNDEMLGKLGFPVEQDIGEAGQRLITVGKIMKVLRGFDSSEALEIIEDVKERIKDLRVEFNAGDYVNEDTFITYVFQRVAAEFHIGVFDLIGRSRGKTIAIARQVAMYFLYMSNKYNELEIGIALGGRCPGTVSYGFQRVLRLFSEDKELKKRISRIDRSIKS